MLQFILMNVLMLSVGAVLYIMVRALPRIEDEPASPDRKTFLDRLVMSGIPERVDATLNGFLGKLFRKLKVFLMRFDNYLTERLKSIKTENGNGKNGNHADYIKELTGPVEEAVEKTDNSKLKNGK